MDQRYWMKVGRSGRCQAYWSDGGMSLMLSGDRREVRAVVEEVAHGRGLRAPQDNTIPVEVIPGQMEIGELIGGD